MSAILPTRPTAKKKPGLSLSLSTPSTPSSSSAPLPSLLPPSSSRPSLKLLSLTPPAGPLSLSLSIPVKGPSRYATALNGPSSSDDEGEGDASQKRERMAGELKDVIRGSGGLEDELSGRTRRMALGLASLSCTGTDGQNVEEGEREVEVNPGTLEDLGRLGEGASGEVRKVLHRPSGIVMAKKTISTSPNPKIHKQHLRELQFMRECSNPHIVQYYGAFLEDNDSQIGICMEYCEGGSLETLYKKTKAKGWRTGEKVLGKVAESVLAGLVYLHDLKIIHRDIKPSNVLVTKQGQIKLCDFGVSGELINSLAGTFVGTTFYLSPERIRGGQYSINSDVWSMALTVLEVALNRFPFPGPGEATLNGPIELLTYLTTMDPPAVPDEPEHNIKYSNAFRNFIQLCLDKNPSTRPFPKKLLSHPWIKRSIDRDPPADLAGWVRSTWESV